MAARTPPSAASSVRAGAPIRSCNTIAPVQEHRRDLEKRPGVVKDVLANGKDRAIKRAAQNA